MKFGKLMSRAVLMAALSFCSLATIPAAFASQQVPYVCQVSYTGASVAANTTSTVAINCPGAALGDIVSVSDSAAIGAFQVSAYVSAAGVVTVNISNVSAGPLTPATGTLTVRGTHVYVPPLVTT